MRRLAPVALLAALAVTLPTFAAPTSQPSSADAVAYPALQKRMKEYEAEIERLKARIAELEGQLAAKPAEPVQTPADAPASPAQAQAPAPAATPVNAAAPAGDGVVTAQFVSIDDANFGKRIAMRLTNVSGKPIKAIKGSVTFKDQFGDMIGNFAAAVQVDEPLAAGASVEKSGVWPMVNERAVKLMEASPKDVTLEWKTSKVAYQE